MLVGGEIGQLQHRRRRQRMIGKRLDRLLKRLPQSLALARNRFTLWSRADFECFAVDSPGEIERVGDIRQQFVEAGMFDGDGQFFAAQGRFGGRRSLSCK